MLNDCETKVLHVNYFFEQNRYKNGSLTYSSMMVSLQMHILNRCLSVTVALSSDDIQSLGETVGSQVGDIVTQGMGQMGKDVRTLMKEHKLEMVSMRKAMDVLARETANINSRCQCSSTIPEHTAMYKLLYAITSMQRDFICSVLIKKYQLTPGMDVRIA